MSDSSLASALPLSAFPLTDTGAPAARILITDDSPVVRAMLEKFLKSRGYEVATADSGDAALALLGRERFTLMLCDVEMPGMTGVELVPRAMQVDPELAVIMLSAVDNASTATGARDGGALDYLVKPVEPPQLLAALDRALRRRTLLIEQRRVDHMIREEVELRTAELEREKAALRGMTLGLAEVLINVMETRDPHLRGHSRRVAELAASMGERMELDAEQVEALRLAGLLHDVGKLAVRESVLLKSGELTPEELIHVRGHVEAGLEILRPVAQLGEALRYIEEHHERLDGSGYPRCLRGDDISRGGRILAVANAYDALLTERSHRPALEPGEAMERVSSDDALDADARSALRDVVGGRKALPFLD